MSDLLRRGAELAAQRPSMIAGPLLRYAAARRLDDEQLAAALGCPPERLPALLWCGRPRPHRFREDVQHIAEHFHLDAGALAEALRFADALEAFDADASQQRWLAAARDREPDEPDES